VNPHEAVVYQIDIEGKYLKMASIAGIYDIFKLFAWFDVY
jgi:hypothetical protein